QKHMGPVGQRRSEIFAVKLLDIRIFMGITDFGMLIQEIQPFPAFKGPLLSIVNRLAAAADAAAGTGHDLYKVIVDLAALDLLQKPPGIAQPADNSRPNRNVSDGKLRLLDALVGVESAAPNRFKRVGQRIFLPDQ